MGARRKQIQVKETLPETPRPELATATGALDGGLNRGLAAQRLRLEAAYPADADGGRRYPGAVRLAIIFGGAAGLWALMAGGVHLLLTL